MIGRRAVQARRPTAPTHREVPSGRHHAEAVTSDSRSSSLRGVNKSFGAVQVLHDVDFDVYPGQVTALVGDNGAGKSTLIKGIAGIYGFDTGDLHLRGLAGRRCTSPKQANALGIEVVYQDLALCDNLDIVQNMFLGRERSSVGRPWTRRPWSSGATRDARRPVGAHREVGPPELSPACPAGSARPSRSPAPCSGTPRSSSSTSRRRRSAWPRPSRCSTSSAGWPTEGSASS